MPSKVGKVQFGKPKHKARAGIIHSNNLSIWDLRKFSGPDVATVMWKTGFSAIPELLFCSLYRSELGSDGKRKALVQDTFSPH